MIGIILEFALPFLRAGALCFDRARSFRKSKTELKKGGALFFKGAID